MAVTNAHGALAPHREQPRKSGVAPWQPRTLCELSDLAALNACSVRRAPFRGSIEGLPIELDLSPTYMSAPAATADDRFEAILSWGDAQAIATLAFAPVRRLLERIQPELSDDPPSDPALSLLVELALAPLFAKIEMSTGTPLTLRSSSRRAAGDLPRP